MTSSGLTRCFEPTSPTSEMANADKDSAPLLLDLVSFTLVDGILYHRDRKAVAWPPRRLPLAPLQLVVPPQLRQAILRGHHESVLAARGGINATYMAIRQRYWWRSRAALPARPSTPTYGVQQADSCHKGQYTAPLRTLSWISLAPCPPPRQATPTSSW